MSKKNDDFFKNKKQWSVVKDELLRCYLKPYVSKILHTYKPLVYVDCFAGKGRFEDGNDGSPIIALRTISDCQNNTKVQNALIETTFIDLNYADDLRGNLSDYPEACIVSGKFEDNIDSILHNKDDCNVFLYIDPYGIKALKCSFFDRIARDSFNSIELLINLNSFGFVREACRALGTVFDDKALFADLIEYEPTEFDASDKSIIELNEIAGGDYWQQIIGSYKNGEIDGYEAEARFAEKYCERLAKSYTYVLNMPLRIKRGQRPKYRLVHATNHRDGCLLMVDNICNRWEALRDIQTGGQVSMFEEDCNNQQADTEDIKRKAKEFFSRFNSYVSLYDALAMFFVKYGPICSTSVVNRIIREFDEAGLITIKRSPSQTPKGKKTTFMTEGKGKTVSVRWTE